MIGLPYLKSAKSHQLVSDVKKLTTLAHERVNSCQWQNIMVALDLVSLPLKLSFA